jgi:3-oxoacyl-[acyl-carrier-protein] synthase II
VGAVKDLSGASYLQNERNARVLNRSFELLVAAGALAAADAALGATPVPPPRLGVIVGIGPIDQYTDDLVSASRRAAVEGGVNVAQFAETARTMYPLRRLRLLPNVGPALLSIEHRAMGPSLTLVSGHAAGLQAIAQGLAMIADGRVDAVLCGGADSRLTPLEVRLFGLQCPLCPSDDPDRACRPFDRRRDGVTPGEGAAILLLEAEDSARARGVATYAELVACASAGPTEGGCAESMRRVVLGRSAEVVVAHGEGGIQSDRLEAAAIDLVSPRCITSLQAVVGHTMSACGALNMAAGCLILADERVPPIRSLESPEVTLPFAMHQVRARFSSVLVNAVEPDNAAASGLLARA